MTLFNNYLFLILFLLLGFLLLSKFSLLLLLFLLFIVLLLLLLHSLLGVREEGIKGDLELLEDILIGDLVLTGVAGKVDGVTRNNQGAFISDGDGIFELGDNLSLLLREDRVGV